MRTIKLAFYRAWRGGPIDWLIALFSFGWASHVEAVFEDGVSFSSVPFKGTRWDHNFHHTLEKEKGKWITVDIHVTSKQYNDFRFFCETEKGCGYDWFGVLAFIIPFLKDSKERWFCTEVLLAAFRREGMFTRIPWKRTTPTQMYKAALKQNTYASDQKDQQTAV